MPNGMFGNVAGPFPTLPEAIYIRYIRFGQDKPSDSRPDVLVGTLPSLIRSFFLVTASLVPSNSALGITVSTCQLLFPSL